jgi:transposase-like protein
VFDLFVRLDRENPAMDRDLLKHFIDQGMSLPQIGELVNRDPSTVGYWVHKHGLVANGRDKYAPRGGLTREQLEPLVESGATLQEIADELNRNPRTVWSWLKRHGLSTKNGRGRRRAFSDEEIAEAVRNGTRTVVGVCRRHGRTEFALVGSANNPRCNRCRAEAVMRRRRKVKRILVDEAGGACMLCGYDRCVAALEFHHLDRDQKAFGLAQLGITRSIDEVRKEAQKCLLVCSNCHAEIEAGATTIPLELAQAIAPA